MHTTQNKHMYMARNMHNHFYARPALLCATTRAIAVRHSMFHPSPRSSQSAEMSRPTKRNENEYIIIKQEHIECTLLSTRCDSFTLTLVVS